MKPQFALNRLVGALLRVERKLHNAPPRRVVPLLKVREMLTRAIPENASAYYQKLLGGPCEICASSIKPRCKA